MSERGWKKAERMLAREVGNEREPVTGERAGRDFGKRGMFAYQVKVRRALPAWLFDWLGGIVTTARRHNQIGVLDWVDLHGVPTGRELSAPDGGEG